MCVCLNETTCKRDYIKDFIFPHMDTYIYIDTSVCAKTGKICENKLLNI